MANKIIRKIILSGMLTALSTILMLVEFYIPPFQSFLKVDFSDVIVFIALFILGFEYAIIIAVLKNWLKFLLDPGAGGVPGHLFDSMMSIFAILIIYLVFLIFSINRKRIKGIYILYVSLTIVWLLAPLFACLINYGFILKMYGISGLSFRDIIITYYLFTLIKYSLIIFVSGVLIIYFGKIYNNISDYDLVNEKINFRLTILDIIKNEEDNIEEDNTFK